MSVTGKERIVIDFICPQFILWYNGADQDIFLSFQLLLERVYQTKLSGLNAESNNWPKKKKKKYPKEKKTAIM